MTAENAPPEEIRVSPDRRTLSLKSKGGEMEAIPAEMLRVLSPSAEVQGHSPEQRKTVGGKQDVRIADIVPVGHYAIRIVFDDGHDSGLYTWGYLSEMARNREERWQTYLDELHEKGLKRSL